MRLGFGFFFGVFLIVWGGFGMAQHFGFIDKAISFPWFPLALVCIGGAMVFKRLF